MIKKTIATLTFGFAHLALANQVFVSLDKQQAVAVFAAPSSQSVSLIEVGEHPRGLALSSNHKGLYVAVNQQNAIKRIDVATQKVIDSWACPNPKSIVLSGDERYLYSSDDEKAVLYKLDLAERRIVQTVSVAKEPEGLALSPNGRWLVTVSESENRVQWLDSKTLNELGSTLVADRPRAAQFSADGQQLWVSAENAGTLTIIDAASRTPLKLLSFSIAGIDQASTKPVGIVFDKHNRFAYVALGRANHVAVIDVKQQSIIKYIAVGQRVWHLAIADDQSHLYSANGGSGDVSVIDLASHELIQTVAVGQGPWAIVAAP